ncbi:MAG TPA: DUF4089 domain-containing protein [Trichocoleus sp.]
MSDPEKTYPFDSAAYVDQMSAFLRLPIPPELRDGVIENLERIWDIAQPVVEFPLPDDLEAAPIFEP